MDNKPIGIFDSGLGGLTAVREILQILPREDVVYFGDTGRVPYGTRSRETIEKYARQDMAFLLAQNVKLVVAACGTVSSVAGHLGRELCVPFTGVVEPTAQAACLATRNGRIGVIGTTATMKSGAYQQTIARTKPQAQVFAQDCPLFVPLVENGFTAPENDIVRAVVRQYLTGLKEAEIDTLILGCTHYPLLYQAIADFMGQDVFLVDSGKETAVRAAELLEQQNLLSNRQKSGRCTFFVSDSTEDFAQAARLFLEQKEKQQVQFADIEAFAQANGVI